MGKYVSVAPNKESAMRGGLDEALLKCIADMKNASLIKESLIKENNGNKYISDKEKVEYYQRLSKAYIKNKH